MGRSGYSDFSTQRDHKRFDDLDDCNDFDDKKSQKII